MERPSSQLENARPSGLKPPSRLPAAKSTSNLSGRPAMDNILSDLNASEINAKTSTMNGTMMPPPSTVGGSIKHKIAGLPEPPTKRKTLVERAGEPTNPLRSHMPQPSKPTFARSEGVYPTTIAGRQQPNMGGYISTTGYRNTSNTSTSSSTSSIHRPGSRVNGNKHGSSRHTNGRPPSAVDMQQAAEEEAEVEAGIMGKRKAWDTKGRLEDMEQLYSKLRNEVASAADTKRGFEEQMEFYKAQVQELALANKELEKARKELSSDLERARNDLHATTTDLRQARRDHERDAQDAERKHERELNDAYAKQEREVQQLHRELEKIVEQNERGLEELRRQLEKQKDDETAELTTQHWEEIEEVKTAHRKEVERLEGELDELKQAGESRATESASEVSDLRDRIKALHGQIEDTDLTTKGLRSQITAAEARCASVEQEKAALVSKTHFLEGNQEAQSQEFTSMRDQLEAARASEAAVIAQLRKEEAARRKLNAQILELKGNIRVFVRTRPLLAGEEEDPAKVEYPDLDDLDGGKEMVVQGPKQLTATGKERVEKHSYAFDRVFDPTTANQAVFEECRELIQSVVDGYNVSILSYGQTGSGKTFGMSGPNGIIPSSIALLLEEMQRLKSKGWEYHVEASFVEVYNETLNDLLGDAKTWDDGEADLSASVRGKKKEKHEIHHDAVTGKTTVTNLSSVTLWPPPEDDSVWPPAAPMSTTSTSYDGTTPTSYTENAVSTLLERAAKNRRVAATNSNARSSRSHSIFILTLRGACAASSEKSEGVLNLVDLAGSERLKASGAEGDRRKETQAINKSLSSLGDVIGALGNKKEGDGHVPYRNSKLTYLLQSSLGGTAANGKSSRTLMLLHLSPLAAHWQESRSSLLFGCKVHGTHIGAAKKK